MKFTNHTWQRHTLPLALTAVTLSALSLTSCQDYDAGFTAADFKAKEYADQFKKDFGDVDPNHDWSMAGRYSVEVYLDDFVNGKLEIFTKSPSVKGSLYIGSTKVVNGKASYQFDAVKGATDFYARVVGKNGSNITDGYYSVEDMTLTVGNSAATRAEGTCPVTKGALWSAEAYGSRTMFRVREDAYKEMKTLSPQSYAQLATIPNVNNPYARKWGYATQDATYNAGSTEAPGANAEYTVKAMFELATPQNLYYLNGVDLTQHNAGFTLEYLKNIFLNDDAVFKEAVDHTELANQGITQKDVIFNVSEDGPVTIDCIWRGTVRDDFFGYYYYTGTAPTEEELWEMPKFILLSDTESDIEQGTSPDACKGWIQSSSRLTEYFDGTTWYAETGSHTGSTGTKIRGRSIKLTYFGTDGNGTPTYTFPANTKIGFFLGGKHGSQYEIYFSDSKMSYALGGQYNGAGSAEKGYGNRPMAATFKYDGNTFFGIGDYNGDADLNDLCFFVRGVDTPDEDLTHDDIKPKPMSWTLACEDLGGTFDYDFNDLVFDVVLTENADNTTRTLTIEALAAGGTLDARLMYNGVDKGEVHGMFSESETSIPINVGSKGKTGKSASPITLATDISKDASVEDICKDIKVKVGNENDVVFISRESKNGIITPQMLILPGGWDWPTENTPITTVYPNFGKWIANYTYNTDWTAHREGSDFITSPKADAVIQVTEGGSGSGSGSGSNDPVTPLYDATSGVIPSEIDVTGFDSYVLGNGSNKVNLAGVYRAFDDVEVYVQVPAGYGFHGKFDGWIANASNVTDEFVVNTLAESSGSFLYQVTLSDDIKGLMLSEDYQFNPGALGVWMTDKYEDSAEGSPALYVKKISSSQQGGADYTQYGTLVTLDADNVASKDDLKAITTTGPVEVTVIGEGVQYNNGNVRLGIDVDYSYGGHGYQNNDIANVSSSSSYGANEVAIITITLTPEQYETTIGTSNYGGLKFYITNINNYSVRVKKSSQD